MMGDLLWRASLLFPDPRMGKAAAVLCAASAICAANGHELAALAALVSVPFATFAIFFHRMVVKTLEHMGASGRRRSRTSTSGRTRWARRGATTSTRRCRSGAT